MKRPVNSWLKKELWYHISVVFWSKQNINISSDLKKLCQLVNIVWPGLFHDCLCINMQHDNWDTKSEAPVFFHILSPHTAHSFWLGYKPGGCTCTNSSFMVLVFTSLCHCVNIVEVEGSLSQAGEQWCASFELEIHCSVVPKKIWASRSSGNLTNSNFKIKKVLPHS